MGTAERGGCCRATSWAWTCATVMNMGSTQVLISVTLLCCLKLTSGDLTAQERGIWSNFDYRQLTPKELLASSELLIKNFTAVYDAIGNLTKEEVNFENVIKALIDSEGESTRRIAAITFASKVATNKYLRDASGQASKE
eukprot:TRINITY_DN21755_c0_g1_i1.p1 TRINITY_DN21755_c0_g1~~TRINITY_DN21755_c0_g1_i1.p1  ORF type:complete len:148 (-),score=25.32 TRINITY_DN21755_c0_g1_i1:57-476(-)